MSRTMAGLTPKQQRFVEEYLLDLNATQAAIRAGYSAKGATVRGSELLANRNVADAIALGQSARSERTKINADWVLERLAAEAEADLADLYSEDGLLKPIAKWPLIWRQGLVTGLDVNEIMVEGLKVGEVIKLRQSDRLKRIELIGRHVNIGAFRDYTETTLRVTEITRRIVDARPENQPVMGGNGRLSAPGAATNGKTPVLGLKRP